MLWRNRELKSANREMSRSAREEFHSTARMAFRPAGQKSPLSDLGARMSGSSFRTLYTLVLTARANGTLLSQHRGAYLDMKEGPGKRDILSRTASKKAAARPRSAPPNEPKLVLVPLPEGVRHQRVGQTTERSMPAHLEKLKRLFEAAPINRYLGMTLGYCENGVARVRLRFRAEFEEGHGVIHGGLIGLLADTAGNFSVGSVSPGSTVKTVEFKLNLLAGVQGDLLAIGEVVRKGACSISTCALPWCITLDNSKGISRLRFWAKNSRVNGINDLPVFMHQGRAKRALGLYRSCAPRQRIDGYQRLSEVLEHAEVAA